MAGPRLARAAADRGSLFLTAAQFRPSVRYAGDTRAVGAAINKMLRDAARRS